MTERQAVLTFRALSALLTYPSEELCAAVPEIEEAIASEKLVPPAIASALRPLLNDLASLDLFELQERYVELFDRSRRLSLHLFEHVHGESRDRGQAMVDLAALYEKDGLELQANELPDYLPLFLEYLSTKPLGEALNLLSETAHILGALEERLVSRESPYAAVLTAIRVMAGVSLDTSTEVELPASASGDLAALDAEWEETAVTFGPGGGAMDGCSSERLQTRLRAAHRDVRSNAH
ncbi:nitrate reductase molybdenum cofactor assembly chaperone [Rhizobium paranaense]|uniref:Nitrate reductase delta subunit n=1 Tax=Rhizobium paranaense TaxID=1650438 RepID=A0A7W9D2T2_9HYPH|nr:nitrate reductase molybdenum cofactor assembly chaperone [Rhizobium paranaense]MBB5575465.1 nitrate reductase delta subunit [Rhizobium paranaense]